MGGAHRGGGIGWGGLIPTWASPQTGGLPEGTRSKKKAAGDPCEETGDKTEQGGVDKTPSCQLPGLICWMGRGPHLYLFIQQTFPGCSLCAWPCAKHWETWPNGQIWPVSSGERHQ